MITAMRAIREQIELYSGMCQNSVANMEPLGMGEEKLLARVTEQIRMKRKGQVGKVWMVDEILVRVKGVWCLYRGIDEDGDLACPPQHT